MSAMPVTTPLQSLLHRTFGGTVPFTDPGFQTGIAHLPKTRRSDGFMRKSRALQERITANFPGVVLQQSRFAQTGWGGLLDQDIFQLSTTDKQGKAQCKTIEVSAPARWFTRWRVYLAARQLYNQFNR